MKKTLSSLLVMALAAATCIASQPASASEPSVVVTPSMKEVLGATHTSGRYYFGDEDFLNEGAERMLALGSENIKVWLSSRPQESYPYNSQWPADIGKPTGPQSMLDILQLPYYQELLEKPFRTMVFEAIEFGPAKADGSFELTTTWKDGLSEVERAYVNEQFYELTKYLLERFQHTGRTFILQNWESDNALLAWETPAAALPTGIQGMIDWSNARQEGIDRARNEVAAEGVVVAGALEVNRIPAGGATFDHKLVVDEIVPHTHMDLYSFSTWGTRLPGEEQGLLAKLAYYKEKAPDSALFGADNLMLGEFGAYETTYNKPVSCPQNNYEATLSPGADNEFNETTGLAQLTAVRKQLENALRMGVRYALYWELYDNGLNDGVTLDQLDTDERGYKVARMDQLRGVWLVRGDGTYTPTWHYFANLYDPKSITDPMNDWSRTYSRTSNLSFAGDEANTRAEGDESRIVNASASAGSVVYRTAHPITDFAVKAYYHGSYRDKLSLYTSADGQTWREAQATSREREPVAENGWFSSFVGPEGVPANTRFVKLTLKGNSSEYTQLSAIQVSTTAEEGDPGAKYYRPAELVSRDSVGFTWCCC